MSRVLRAGEGEGLSLHGQVIRKGVVLVLGLLR